MAGNSGAVVDLPIIDVSSSDMQAAKDIVNAASTYGFVFVKGYESLISESNIGDMFSLVSWAISVVCKLEPNLMLCSHASSSRPRKT